jgi:hypothetical protein
MKSNIMKYVLRYVLFVGIPYVIARKVEKRYLKLKDNPVNKTNSLDNKTDNLDNKPENPAINIRGGEIFAINAIIELLMKDFAYKTALTGLVGSTIWGNTADNAVEQIMKYAGAIVAAPGHKFLKILKRFRKIDDNYASSIKQILLEKDTSNEEKCELIRLKVQYALKNLKGKKRITFIASIVALLMFFLGNNTTAFAYFMTSLKGLIGEKDDDSIKNYIIDVYKEYNAPLPEELITQITNEL